MTTRTAMRIMFCSTLALVIMTATALAFMLALHYSDLADACGVRKSKCEVVCPKCGVTFAAEHR
jgi:hypothetical protein